MILQYIYRPFCNFIYKYFLRGVPEIIKDGIVILGVLVMIWTGFFSDYGNDGVWPYWDDTRDWIFAGALLIVIIFSIRKKTEILRWSIPVWLTYVLTGALIVYSSFSHDPGRSYVALGILMLTEFVFLGFVWGNRGDYDKLFRLASIAVLLFNIVIIAICFKNYPYISDPMKDFHEAGNYWFWHVKNPNGTVKLFLAIDTGVFYLAKTSRKFWKSILLTLLLGADLYITYITNARNALLIILLCILALFYDFIMKIVKDKVSVKKLILKAWAIGMCVIIGVGASFCCLTILQRDKIEEVPYRTSEPKEKAQPEVDINATYDIYSREYILQKKMLLEQGYPKLYKIDRILTGRIYYWWAYLENMDTTGHNKSLQRPPHNLYLLMAWRCGAQTGLVWFICTVLCGLRIFIAFLRKRSTWTWFSLTAFFVFFVQAMLEQGLFPMERPYVLLFYIGMLPCFLKVMERPEAAEDKA